MNEKTIFRNPHERILSVPLFGNGCPHQHGKQVQQRQEEQEHEQEIPYQTQLTPHIVIKRTGLGHLVQDSDRRHELKEEFERSLDMDDTLYPIKEPETVARVMRNQGIVFKEL